MADASQESAFDVMAAMLREWGLESLAPTVRQFLEDGRTPEQITILIQDTEEYKKRFAGNELRRKKGLAALSPADYLAVEGSYRQIMESAGLPSGFYDQPEDFVQWIGNDVAPAEIRERVDTAMDIAFSLDEDTASAFREFYGITQQNIAAYFLDRDRGLRELERISRAGRIGGIATGQGLEVGRQRAERLAQSDLSGGEFRQAVSRVAQLTTDVGRLSGIHGVTYGQRDAEDEVFFADENARRRRRQLRGVEQGQFSGGAGGSPAALAQNPGSI